MRVPNNALVISVEIDYNRITMRWVADKPADSLPLKTNKLCQSASIADTFPRYSCHFSHAYMVT